MPGRSKTLKRLVDLYGAMEAARSGEMQRAQILLLEAEQALRGQQAVKHMAHAEGRDALGQGDRMAWMFAEVQAELASVKRRRIEPIAEERGASRDAAKKKYLASRLESEQMNRLFDDAAKRAAVMQLRRAQAVADDRFLSRKRWAEMKAERLLKKEPRNVSAL
ncbi:hypothetical protein [Granulicella sp. dw_53]|uniref:hypothetical protein n=1 Tax=Granulicella sp. dw_53 TaxID=2719792 RepID=UPI001BD486DC|nr:hypothetical protein [Granulicella sp. dw_53]